MTIDFNALLVHGDSLDPATAAEFKSGHFQLLVTSTPYPGQRGFDKNVLEYLGSWLPRLLDLWLPKINPVTGVVVQNIKFKRDDGWFDTRIFEIPRLYERRGLRCIDTYIWDKLNPAPAGNLDNHDIDAYEFCFAMAMSSHYTFNKVRAPYAEKTIGKAEAGNMRQSDVWGNLAGGHSDLHPDGARQHNVLRVSSSGDQGRPRVTGGSFPRGLADRFILTYSDPGDWILDTCGGAGTVLVQSLLNGRRSVYIDSDYDAWRTATRWHDEANSFGPLFGKDRNNGTNELQRFGD